MPEAISSQAALVNRQLAGTNNVAQQRTDARSNTRREEAGDAQPTSTAGVNGQNALQDRVAISSQPTDQVNRTAETTERAPTRNTIGDIPDLNETQSSELARRQAEVRTNQESLGNVLDIDA